MNVGLRRSYQHHPVTRRAMFVWLLQVAGSMQESYEHALRPTAAKAFAAASRINITVRAFNPDSEAVTGVKSTR